MVFHKAAKSRFWLSLPRMGLIFVNKDLNMVAIYFFSLKDIQKIYVTIIKTNDKHCT